MGRLSLSQASVGLLLLALGPLGCAPAAGAAAPTPPSCDAIRGVTTAQDSRWRVFLPYGSAASRPQLLRACRRAPGPARTVIRLARNVATDGACRCRTAEGLSGDRLLVLDESGLAGGVSRTRHTLIDLARGTAATVGPDGFARPAGSGPSSFPWASLTARGGVIMGADQPDASRSDLAAGYWWRFGQGTPVAQPSVARHMAPSRGGRGLDPGVYLTTLDGVPLRVGVSGPAQLPATRRAELRPRPNRLVAASPRHRTLSASDGVAIDLVEPGANMPRPWIQAATQLGSARLAVLAPRRSAPVVLAGSSVASLVSARFGDRPDVRRVRLLDHWGTLGVRLDLDPGTVPTAPGMTAITRGGALAVADGDTLRIWDPAPRTLVAPGVHDLSPVALNDLYFTDVGGVPHRVTLGGRTA